MLNAAIIGLGWWGKQIVTCLADSPRFKVVAGCDIDTRMAASFAAEQKLDLIDDYRSLNRRADLDRWTGAERAGAPGTDGVAASAARHWGLAARGAVGPHRPRPDPPCPRDRRRRHWAALPAAFSVG